MRVPCIVTKTAKGLNPIQILSLRPSFCLKKRARKTPILSPNLSIGSVAAALRQAAAALAAVARALQKGGSVLPNSPAHTIIHASNPDTDLTLREAVNEMLASKARIYRSARYLRQLRVSLILHPWPTKATSAD